MAVLRRVIGDVLDLGLLVLVVLFLYGMNFVLGSAIAPVRGTYIFDIVTSGNPVLALKRAFFDALSQMASPMAILAIAVYWVLSAYLLLVVIGWIGKKRISVPENPFKRAFDMLIPSIVLSIIVFAPIFFLLALVFLTSGSTFFLALSALFLVLLVYAPIVSPAFASLGIDAEHVRDALSNGTVVGRRKWLSILGYLFVAGIIEGIILQAFGYLALLFPWAAGILYAIYSAIAFILPIAVITEVYIADAHGE